VCQGRSAHAVLCDARRPFSLVSSVIEASHLQKHFGRVTAVRDVSLRAADGRITGLLGPNGAGKSTTLRILYTVIAPENGDALIDGVSVVTRPLEARKRIGVLPHNAGIYPNLSGRENIVYFGALHGLSRGDRQTRAVELISLLEMEEFADRPAKGFSQGQRIKTALARALIHRPRNLLLDEPTNGLDVMAVRGLRRLLGRLRDEGHCVLFSSHVMQEVGALCDDVVVIAHGTVVATGTPEELRVQTGESNLEDAFVRLIGTGEGLS
jgi:sodium transport system ATP-binding protein